MKSSYKQDLKVLGLLFTAFLLAYGIGLPLLTLVVMPLARWAIHGALFFSTDSAFLLRLAWLILGMSVVTTIVMWLEGKRKGRW